MSEKNYVCKLCHYKTDKRQYWYAHIKTAKHKFGPIGRELVREKSSIDSLKYIISLL